MLDFPNPFKRRHLIRLPFISIRWDQPLGEIYGGVEGVTQNISIPFLVRTSHYDVRGEQEAALLSWKGGADTGKRSLQTFIRSVIPCM